MYQLAKVGFTQSYTYFAWKNTSAELTEYFTELTQPPVREFFSRECVAQYSRHFERVFAERWPAGVCGAIYFGGDPRCQLRHLRTPRLNCMKIGPFARAAEEYLNSEKYEVRVWDTNNPNSLRDLITRINAIRKGSPALHGDWSLRFPSGGQ